MWFKNNDSPINSSEYEKLSKRIIELLTEVETLQAKVKVLQTNYDDLRGKFNRKLSGIKKEEETEMEEETKSINNPVILPFNGNFYK